MNQTNIICISSIILMIIVLVAVWALSSFVSTEAYQLSEQRKAFYADTMDRESTVSIQKQMDELGRRNLLLERLFLEKDNVVSFIGEIETLGVKHNVLVETQVVDASDFDNLDGTQEYGDLRVAFSATGSWGDVYRFINLVENIPYYSHINTMKMSSSIIDKSVVWEVMFSISVATDI